jgi:hypothetical protein
MYSTSLNEQAALAPKYVEQIVWSDRFQYAGTLDVVGTLMVRNETAHAGPTVFAVVDWKTNSRALYPEAGLQIAAYAAALIEMRHAPPTTWGVVVRIPKRLDDPPLEMRLYAPDELRRLFRVFRHVLAVWAWTENRLAPWTGGEP